MPMYRPIPARSARAAAQFAAVAVLALTAACGDSDGPENVARVRFLHSAQGRAAIDFRADGTTRGAALAFGGAFSAATVLPSGARTFTARLTGGATDLASTGKTLATSASYSVVLAKRPTTDTLVVYTDTTATPAASKAWVRLFHVASAAGAVDVYITAADADLAAATPQESNVAFLSPTKYHEVDAGARRIRLTTTGTKTVLFDLNTINLTSRAVRSIAVLENAAGGTPLQAVTLAERN
jgi:hypothetical protein